MADNVAPLPPTTEAVGPPAALSPPLPHVPGYDALEELGRGGMAVVYKARQTSLNRLVALKMIRPIGDVGPDDRARFLREAEATARLNHPHIVQIYEVGEHDGLPYLCLEYCPGGTLAQRLRHQPITARESAELVRRLARAVQAAHDQQIVHRDLKPSNVLLAEDGTPKITDFGLARLTDQTSHTRHDAVVGTPAYMAPEQADRGYGLPSPPTDIYALGVILYECLTGRVPFRGTTAIDTLFRVVHVAAEPPSHWHPGLSPELDTICLKCLEKSPGKRYSSAQALADDLGRYLRGDPIVAQPPGLGARAAQWLRQRSLPLVTGALLIVILLNLLPWVGSGLRLVQRWADEEAREESEEAPDPSPVEKLDNGVELLPGIVD